MEGNGGDGDTGEGDGREGKVEGAKSEEDAAALGDAVGGGVGRGEAPGRESSAMLKR